MGTSAFRDDLRCRHCPSCSVTPACPRRHFATWSLSMCASPACFLGPVWSAAERGHCRGGRRRALQHRASRRPTARLLRTQPPPHPGSPRRLPAAQVCHSASPPLEQPAPFPHRRFPAPGCSRRSCRRGCRPDHRPGPMHSLVRQRPACSFQPSPSARRGGRWHVRWRAPARIIRTTLASWSPAGHPLWHLRLHSRFLPEATPSPSMRRGRLARGNAASAPGPGAECPNRCRRTAHSANHLARSPWHRAHPGARKAWPAAVRRPALDRSPEASRSACNWQVTPPAACAICCARGTRWRRRAS
mmetsp:Transcript_30836/g.88638  ORF Transcript_30836/g.88638 Transcript_30836/m.88638 type:complete len:302 (+) Transcript_30836:216-1121(+)